MWNLSEVKSRNRFVWSETVLCLSLSFSLSVAEISHPTEGTVFWVSVCLVLCVSVCLCSSLRPFDHCVSFSIDYFSSLISRGKSHLLKIYEMYVLKSIWCLFSEACRLAVSRPSKLVRKIILKDINGDERLHVSVCLGTYYKSKMKSAFSHLAPLNLCLKQFSSLFY